MFRRIVSGIMVAIPFIIWGCSEEQSTSPQLLSMGTFDFEAKYDYIRSQIGGGGLFLVRMVPDKSFDGQVDLEILANPCLQAHLGRKTLNQSSPVAEITIAPNEQAEFKTYQIEVRAANGDFTRSIFLNVEVMQWPCGQDDDALQKLEGFMEWLKKEYPELGDISVSVSEWKSYLTYPQILVVEHWTFLSEEWEIRLCYHVMIPPDDWSYFRLRRRGGFEPTLAAKRDTQGELPHGIDVEDYPLMYGY